ncbi:MAG: Cof-type HAD-IIB family hydrolase [Clostridiales bacterium]|nr:Cof-type HAD-IIB family hydrolase [Clostridiales bacterium]
MDYKLIALDIDGTLTNSNKEITPGTRYALLEAQRQGKKLIIASGRHPIGIYPIARDLMLERYGGYIMAFNGGKIIDCSTGETVVSKYFPREYLPDIAGVLKDSSITMNTYDDKRIISDSKVDDYTYVERDIIKAEMVVVDDFISAVRFDINKILLAGEPDEIDKYEKILSDRYDGLLDVYKSAPYFLEIMPFGVTKGSMLPPLLQKMRVKREELAAFGDNYNDITMIGYAGLGVAMGNAERDVKNVADYICESNDEDGVAKTFNRFILNSNNIF